MAVWAHACRLCDSDEPAPVFVSAAAIAEMPGATRLVQVRIDGGWHCAILDRDRRVSVEQMLIRDVVAAHATDCPDCAARLAAADAEPARAAPEAARAGAPAGTVQAAAISLRGQRLVVVLVPIDLVNSPGEASMATERLAATFPGAPVVLMGQQEDGTPRYYGPDELVGMLEGLPLERMPWKVYRLH